MGFSVIVEHIGSHVVKTTLRATDFCCRDEQSTVCEKDSQASKRKSLYHLPEMLPLVHMDLLDLCFAVWVFIF